MNRYVTFNVFVFKVQQQIHIKRVQALVLDDFGFAQDKMDGFESNDFEYLNENIEHNLQLNTNKGTRQTKVAPTRHKLNSYPSYKSRTNSIIRVKY